MPVQDKEDDKLIRHQHEFWILGPGRILHTAAFPLIFAALLSYFTFPKKKKILESACSVASYHSTFYSRLFHQSYSLEATLLHFVNVGHHR